VVSLASLEPQAIPFPAGLRALVEAGYWMLPKPADFGMILQNTLDANSHFAAIPSLETVQQMGAFHPELSVVTSLLFAIGMLAVSARQLVTTDY
jgi:hypothetical protein